MAFIDDALSVATDIFDKAARKSSYLAQVAKLNVKITNYNTQLKDQYARLGKAYFEGLETGDAASAEFARELCEKIVETKAGIDDCKAQIEQLKKEEAEAAKAQAQAKAQKEEEQPQEPQVVEVELEVEETPPVETLYVDESADSEDKE